ncbi:hypothetical protein E4U43_007141 [Claviceps pusilla]|uniref:methionyl-tRNA formyltransferase n=1 Tax=Claviceps pusilla TaxID=123648 RepID=A0A9P7NCZ3_9HYPO|nr:hypothetical protein E4U43_007141 [Claviceps pusilla]
MSMLRHLPRLLSTPPKPPCRIIGPGPGLRRRTSTSTSTISHARPSDPLRILFCGSDAFSCAALRALHAEHVRRRHLVEALEVMVLPGRRMGRGLKVLRQVPCQILAQELGLRVHERETFRGWDLPPGTNLVVVVSFGLFVPLRILSSAKYGGVNVHPSLLPDLRGPAPIHHALLRGDTHMGISLQTLDPKAFDHGTILAQTPAPGFPIPPSASLQTVMQEAAARGAEMLVQGLRDGLHVPPHRDVGWKAAQLQAKGAETLQHAPKITKADGRIDPDWTAEQFARRIRVLGSVWTTAVLHGSGSRKRVLLLDAEPVSISLETEVEKQKEAGNEQQGTLVCEYADEHGSPSHRHERRVRIARDGACLIHARDTAWVRVSKVKVDGKPEQMAATGLRAFLRPGGSDRISSTGT